jgi:hypothetical protein
MTSLEKVRKNEEDSDGGNVLGDLLGGHVGWREKWQQPMLGELDHQCPLS